MQISKIQISWFRLHIFTHFYSSRAFIGGINHVLLTYRYLVKFKIHIFYNVAIFLHPFWNKCPHGFTHHWNTCRPPDNPMYKVSKNYSLTIHQGGKDFGIWPIDYIGYSVSVGWCPCILSSSCSVLEQARSRQPLARTQLGTGQHLDCHDIQLTHSLHFLQDY